MRHLVAVTFVALALVSNGAARAQTASSPPGLWLRVVTAPAGARLAIVREGVERGSVEMPPGLARDAVDAGVGGALWHPNGRDVALGFKGPKASFVIVFLQQSDGSYLAVDVSRVEQANIGAIGPFRTYKDRRTRPVEWLGLSRIEAAGSRYDGAEAVQVRLLTEAWDLTGTRYVGAEPLIITRDGTPLWR